MRKLIFIILLCLLSCFVFSQGDYRAAQFTYWGKLGVAKGSNTTNPFTISLDIGDSLFARGVRFPGAPRLDTLDPLKYYPRTILYENSSSHLGVFTESRAWEKLAYLSDLGLQKVLDVSSILNKNNTINGKEFTLQLDSLSDYRVSTYNLASNGEAYLRLQGTQATLATNDKTGSGVPTYVTIDQGSHSVGMGSPFRDFSIADSIRFGLKNDSTANPLMLFGSDNAFNTQSPTLKKISINALKKFFGNTNSTLDEVVSNFSSSPTANGTHVAIASGVFLPFIAPTDSTENQFAWGTSYYAPVYQYFHLENRLHSGHYVFPDLGADGDKPDTIVTRGWARANFGIGGTTFKSSAIFPQVLIDDGDTTRYSTNPAYRTFLDSIKNAGNYNVGVTFDTTAIGTSNPQYPFHVAAKSYFEAKGLTTNEFVKDDSLYNMQGSDNVRIRTVLHGLNNPSQNSDYSYPRAALLEGVLNLQKRRDSLYFPSVNRSSATVARMYFNKENANEDTVKVTSAIDTLSPDFYKRALSPFGVSMNLGSSDLGDQTYYDFGNLPLAGFKSNLIFPLRGKAKWYADAVLGSTENIPSTFDLGVRIATYVPDLCSPNIGTTYAWYQDGHCDSNRWNGPGIFYKTLSIPDISTADSSQFAVNSKILKQYLAGNYYKNTMIDNTFLPINSPTIGAGNTTGALVNGLTHRFDAGSSARYVQLYANGAYRLQLIKGTSASNIPLLIQTTGDTTISGGATDNVYLALAHPSITNPDGSHISLYSSTTDDKNITFQPILRTASNHTQIGVQIYGIARQFTTSGAGYSLVRMFLKRDSVGTGGIKNILSLAPYYDSTQIPTYITDSALLKTNATWANTDGKTVVGKDEIDARITSRLASSSGAFEKVTLVGSFNSVTTSNSYYLNENSNASGTGSAVNKIQPYTTVSGSGNIGTVYFKMVVQGTLNTGTEACNVYLTVYHNAGGFTDYLITNAALTNASVSEFTLTNQTIPLIAGDKISIRIDTPASFTTSPTNIRPTAWFVIK